ncbi:hypothetical protein GGE07_002498 [Sinorhizobium terangae]|uniref:Uncharacterized protein n=1 Tax=Sinorhizobium terangae TaxID=110322 RepID=A0A6N7LQP4_SINTE|nr:hypothetical protein [Sinorhizobium terangae]MBB4185848.1 hypothetical protein [Sinorhizobium terangae]MQX19360.1 hypothetical protein [Sinorhizobium terangae]
MNSREYSAPMNQPAVTEFVIIPPADMRESIILAAERLQAWLEVAFPGHRFRLETRWAFNDGAFRAIPIMSAGGNGDAIIICETPSPDLIAAISKACGEFDPRPTSAS